MKTELSYRLTTNSPENVRLAGLEGKRRVVDFEIMKAMGDTESCVFIYFHPNSSEKIPIYFIRKYTSNGGSGESELLTKIEAEKMGGLPIYLIYESPIATDLFHWQLYRIAKAQGKTKKAEKIKKRLLLPEKDCLRGVSFSLEKTFSHVEKIAKKRANEIARKINYPILNEIVPLFLT